MYLGKLSDRQTSFQLVRAHTCEKQIMKSVRTSRNLAEMPPTVLYGVSHSRNAIRYGQRSFRYFLCYTTRFQFFSVVGFKKQSFFLKLIFSLPN